MVASLDNELLLTKLENSKMKEINKQLLEQLGTRSLAMDQASNDLDNLFENSKVNASNETTNHLVSENYAKNDVCHIHSLYQDLYVTDLKNDLGDVESEL